MRIQGKLLSTDGRLSQRGYVLYFVLPFLALLALTFAAPGVAGDLYFHGGQQVLVLGWLGWVVTADAQNVRRYHDIGNSGRIYLLLRPLVVLIPVLAFVLQFLLPAQMASMGDMSALIYMIGQDADFHLSPVTIALAGLWAAGLILNVLYLSVMPGDHGPNSHGPDPRQGASNMGAPMQGEWLQGGKPAPSAHGTDDPVQRALAEYKASLAKPAPAVQPRPGAAPRATSAPRQAGAAFGRKR